MIRPEIVKAAGRDWVAGLTWRAFAHYPTKQERREDAQLLGADWVAFRTTPDVTQAGFCPQISQYLPKGLYSLAAAVAMEYPQPWQGVFQISETIWWYVAVRDGQAILPDGDVIGNYDTIIVAQARHQIYNDWTIQNGTINDLALILEFSSKANGLSPVRTVNPKPLWKLISPFLFFTVIAVIAIILYKNDKQTHHEVVQHALLKHETPLPLKISPLATMPAPEVWLASCQHLMKSIPVSNSGWALSSFTCYSTYAVILWDRQDGTTLSQRPHGTPSADGNEITQTFPLGPFPQGSQIIRSYEREDTALYTILQPLNVQANIGSPIFINTKTSQQSISFTLPISPFSIHFNKIPGLRLTALQWDQEGWKVQGELYGK